MKYSRSAESFDLSIFIKFSCLWMENRTICCPSVLLDADVRNAEKMLMKSKFGCYSGKDTNTSINIKCS